MTRRRYHQTSSMYYAPAQTRPIEPSPAVVQPDARPYLHKRETVMVSFLMALISGGFAGLLTFIITLVCNLSAWAVALWTFGTIAVVSVLVWSQLLFHWIRLTGFQQVWWNDVPDQQIITPEVTIRLQDTREGGFTEHLITLPVDEDKLRILFRGLYDGIPLAEDNWIGSHGIFSKNEFYALRVELLKRHLIAQANPKSPAQGYKLTREGCALMQHYSPPSLEDGK
jgi:hypothetical protein